MSNFFIVTLYGACTSMSFTLMISTDASADSFTMLMVYFAVFPVSDTTFTITFVISPTVCVVTVIFPTAVSYSILKVELLLFAITATSAWFTACAI